MAKISNVFAKEEVKKTTHPKRITKWIHYTKLAKNEKQYCDAKDKEEIEGLADLIEADGMVLQDLLVRKTNSDEYKIIAGHKRHMRFFLTSSLVAFQPFFAQDVIEPGGQMMGLNRTTKHFIVGNRKKLPNPHGIIVGFSGSGKSMLIKLTELSQTLLATDDDIMLIDPQNEFRDIVEKDNGSYFDLTPKSGIFLNGFEVSEEVFTSSVAVQKKFIAQQTEYAKTLCAAAMKNINVTQEHDSIISRCTERMFKEVFEQKKLKKQPTLLWLREEIYKELQRVDNEHDAALIRVIYNSLEEYTIGSCDMLAHPSNVSLNRRMIGFGMSNVPENNWEAVMVTILHYLSIRMDYNKKFQKATHLVIDETQVISKKPGSARQLNNAVITFRKFGGIVTMAMQNVTAALSNQTLIELFQNCSYKTFLDQGGVDAQSLAAIQEFSAKEFKALSSGNVGEGVMVWNKKVVMFDALISKENVLYKNYSTNFHEKAKEQKVLSFEEEAVPKFSTTEKTETRSVLSEKEEELILEVSCIMDITVTDVERLFNQDTETCLGYLRRLEKKGKLKEVNGRYRKVE